MTSAAGTTVEKSVSEVRRPGFMKYSAMVKSELGETPAGDGSPCSGTRGTASATATAVAKHADEGRPSGIAKYSATSKSDLAEFRYEESSAESEPGLKRLIQDALRLLEITL